MVGWADCQTVPVRNRALVIAAAVASALLLSGCTAQQRAPAPPTETEIAAAVDVALDRQWAATGLEGRVPRPDIDVEQIMSAREAGVGMGECVSEAGIVSWGWSETGFTAGSTGGRGTDDDQLIFYSCFARFPEVLVITGAQRDFIYDYYASTYIPCLGLHGYDVVDAPTRADFVSGAADQGLNWMWSPDSTLRVYPDSSADYEKMYSDCPPTVPGIEGWSYVPGFG